MATIKLACNFLHHIKTISQAILAGKNEGKIGVALASQTFLFTFTPC